MANQHRGFSRPHRGEGLLHESGWATGVPLETCVHRFSRSRSGGEPNDSGWCQNLEPMAAMLRSICTFWFSVAVSIALSGCTLTLDNPVTLNRFEATRDHRAYQAAERLSNSFDKCKLAHGHIIDRARPSIALTATTILLGAATTLAAVTLLAIAESDLVGGETASGMRTGAALGSAISGGIGAFLLSLKLALKADDYTSERAAIEKLHDDAERTYEEYAPKVEDSEPAAVQTYSDEATKLGSGCTQ